VNKKREKDEHIERLYYMKEEGADLMDALKNAMNSNFDAAIVVELSWPSKNMSPWNAHTRRSMLQKIFPYRTKFCHSTY